MTLFVYDIIVYVKKKQHRSSIDREEYLTPWPYLKLNCYGSLVPTTKYCQKILFILLLSFHGFSRQQCFPNSTSLFDYTIVALWHLQKVYLVYGYSSSTYVIGWKSNSNYSIGGFDCIRFESPIATYFADGNKPYVKLLLIWRTFLIINIILCNTFDYYVVVMGYWFNCASYSFLRHFYSFHHPEHIL